MRRDLSDWDSIDDWDANEWEQLYSEAEPDDDPDESRFGSASDDEHLAALTNVRLTRAIADRTREALRECRGESEGRIWDDTFFRGFLGEFLVAHLLGIPNHNPAVTRGKPFDMVAPGTRIRVEVKTETAPAQRYQAVALNEDTYQWYVHHSLPPHLIVHLALPPRFSLSAVVVVHGFTELRDWEHVPIKDSPVGKYRTLTCTDSRLRPFDTILSVARRIDSDTQSSGNSVE